MKYLLLLGFIFSLNIFPEPEKDFFAQCNKTNLRNSYNPNGWAALLKYERTSGLLNLIRHRKLTYSGYQKDWTIVNYEFHSETDDFYYWHAKSEAPFDIQDLVLERKTLHLDRGKKISSSKIGCKLISEEKYEKVYDKIEPKRKPTTTEGNKI